MPHPLLAQIASLRERLLDTTTRNRLLNYPHPSRGCARFVGTRLDQAYSQLAAGQSLAIEPVPEPTAREIGEYWRAQGKEDCGDKITPERWARHLGINPDLELASDGASATTRLVTLHYRASQEGLLKRLRSAARSAIEESGTNILFLAFGFLHWRDKAEAERSFLAPLLLVPVELTVSRSKVGQTLFLLSGTGEDIQWNRSLARKLDVDFGRALPEPNLRDDEPPERPIAYLERVRQTISGLSGWAVRPFLTLGLFDFGSFLLWRDLDPAAWPTGAPLAERPLIRRLIGTEEGSEPSLAATSLEIEGHLDLELPLVDRADGSQARAIARALAGETLLVEGPPGTGKSQTITNLLAAALHQGKRVLFVSEKLAALDVVRRRMDALGLGEFCLELHSGKARKRAVLDDLDQSLKRRRASHAVDGGVGLAERLREAHAELSAYGEALLALVPGLEQPVHKVLARAAVARKQATAAGLLASLSSLSLEPQVLDRTSREESLRSLEEVASASLALGGVAGRHPWAGIDATLVQPFDADELLALVGKWATSVRTLIGAVERFQDEFGWSLGQDDEETIAGECSEAVGALQLWRQTAAACHRASEGLEAIGTPLRCTLQLCAADLLLALQLADLASDAPINALPLRSEAFADPAIDRVLAEFDDRRLKVEQAARALPESTTAAAWEEAPEVLLEAARTLEGAGLFGFLRGEVRAARRLAGRLLPRVRNASASQGLRAVAAAIEARRAAENYPAAKALLGRAFDGLATDTTTLRRLRAWVARSTAALAACHQPHLAARFWVMDATYLANVVAAAPALEIVRPLAEIAPEPSRQLKTVYLEQAAPAAIRPLLKMTDEPDLALQMLEELLGHVEAVKQARNAFRERTSPDERLWPTHTRGVVTLRGVLSRLDQALAAPRCLSHWLRYDLARRRAKGSLTARLVTAAEDGHLPPEGLSLAFDYVLFEHAARTALRDYPELRRHDGTVLEGLASRFAELDEGIMEARREAIAARLRQAPVPRGANGFRAADLTEETLLRHEIAKQKRHLPVRRLVERAPRTLQALKPCFMMGPYAVAQHLPPGAISFDLLIVDEASQLRPEESVGTLARAEQAVIVGDTKQLPPTSFFDRVALGDDGDDGDEGVADSAESIMEIARQRLRDAAILRWHYRSRHEALIAWSNAEFYGDELIVFPSAHGKDPRFGIGWHHLPKATCRAGKNEVEANAVVDAVIAHLSAASARSLGVAAMNVKQAELIEELLEQRIAAERPDLVDRLEGSRQGAEPFFVKNLENVQGDERDVMLISMTYGPEALDGRVPQRFGPINRETGWRRLNVLFTRAKERMEIFASMRAGDVVAAGARRGIVALHAFLTYAETGLLRSAHGPSGGGEPESDFEVAVARALEAEGFRCVAQLGFAGFRLDLAIIDPDRPDRYLLAVECDGAAYHSSRSARERDRLRQEILEGLGWEVMRIWSTDWYRDPDREIQRIVGRLRAIVAERMLPPKPILDEATNANQNIEHGANTNVDNFPVESAGLVAGGRTVEDVRAQLIRLREETIHADLPDADRTQGLLRKVMVDTLLRQRPTTPEEFRRRVPEALRLRTDPEQFRRYAPRVFEILAELTEPNTAPNTMTEESTVTLR